MRVIGVALAISLAAIAGVSADGTSQAFPTASAKDLNIIVHGEWGTTPREFGVNEPEGMRGPILYLVDKQGHIITLDQVKNNRIQVFDRRGTLLNVVPLKRIGSATSAAVDDRGRIFLSDSFDVKRIDLASGEATDLGVPGSGPLFQGVKSLAVLDLTPTGQSMAGNSTLIAIWQDLKTLGGVEQWITLTDGSLKCKGAMAGTSPVAGPYGSLFAIKDFQSGGGGLSVRVESWNEEEFGHIHTTTVALPVEMGRDLTVRLLGHPFSGSPYMFILTHHSEPDGPWKVWRIDRRGKIVGAVSLGAKLGPAPASFMGDCDRFVVDFSGNLFVSWSEPAKGYFIGEVPAVLWSPKSSRPQPP